jgi:hypothetical protein
MFLLFRKLSVILNAWKRMCGSVNAKMVSVILDTPVWEQDAFFSFTGLINSAVSIWTT